MQTALYAQIAAFTSIAAASAATAAAPLWRGKTPKFRQLHHLRAIANMVRIASVFPKQNVVKDHFTEVGAHGGIAATSVRAW
jgi:hypothetical protein